MLLKLVSLLGLTVFLTLAWICSLDRRRFPWRTVLSGLALQFALALVILKTDLGRMLFSLAQTAFTKLIDSAAAGAHFVFGPLANEKLLQDSWGKPNAVILAITVTVTIILISSLSALLYHYGVLQRVVRGMAWVMQRVMRTSGSESLSAAANIFMGQTEAPLLVRPYLERMTQSELLAMMVGGMATIAGGVLAVYVSFGLSAGDLLTASVMNAPAALLIAKILLPETQPSETAAGASAQVPRETVNGLDALCHGAGEGMKLSINVMAMLIAFVALVAMTNALLMFPQTKLGVQEPVTLETLFGWANAPFAWLLGIPASDCLSVGRILGERLVLNEFIGYQSLSQAQESLDPRSVKLATYALCGFANFASIAIQIGGIGALVPSRRAHLASLGLRAMLGGMLACYLTACVVGILS